MTDAPTLTIATPFNDVSELTDNFATRVGDMSIMLPYGEPVEEGLTLHFVVLLLDGSVAFEGKGRSTGTNDNGEDFPPEYRYDIVLDSLELAGMSEVMFERFLQAQQSQMEGDPGTGEVDVNQLGDAGGEAPADLPTEARPIEASAPMDAVEAVEEGGDELPSEDWQPEGEFAEQVPTQAVHLDDLARRAVPSAPPAAPVRSAPPPAVPSAPPAPAARPAPPAAPAARPSPPQRPRGSLPAMHTFDHGILTRPSAAAGWAPEMVARPEPAQSSGLFDYQGGLPRPASPPRPEMPDEQRVAAAPSPSAPWSTAAADG